MSRANVTTHLRRLKRMHVAEATMRGRLDRAVRQTDAVYRDAVAALRQERKERHLSRETVALTLGIQPLKLKEYERGKTRFPTDLFWRYVAVVLK
jgi:ribosome-binding protein aMBF1 (putative translation factor)